MPKRASMSHFPYACLKAPFYTSHPCSHIISLTIKAFQDLSAHGSSPNYSSCFALSVASLVCVKTLLRGIPFGSLSSICSLYIFTRTLSQNFCTDEITKPFLSTFFGEICERTNCDYSRGSLST